jgi:pimeloyl-ACP methyl ester carboxylesterase
VLCATFLRHPRALVRALAPLARFAPIHAVPARLAAVMLLGAWATPPRRAALAAALAGVPPAVFRRRLADILPIDVSGLLARVDAPLLVLRAAHDRLVSASAGDAIRRARPDAQVVNVDGPHCLLEAAPRGCADAVRAFLAALA